MGPWATANYCRAGIKSLRGTTPLFMSLARCRSTGKELTSINKDDGSKYLSDQERNEGIVKYYENLYAKPENERIDY